MKKMIVLCALLAISGCTNEMLSDANSLGQGLQDAAPLVAAWNPPLAAIMFVIGGVTSAIAGKMLVDRRKKKLAGDPPKPSTGGTT